MGIFGQVLRFFVFDPSDGQDLIDAWNLRLFERNAVLIHVDWFDRCAPLIRDLIIKNFRPIPGNPFGTMLHATVEFSRSTSQDRAKQLAGEHLEGLPESSCSFTLGYDAIWENRNDTLAFHPQRVRLTAMASDIDENVSDHLSVSFNNAEPRISGRSRLVWTDNLGECHSAEPYLFRP